ncbi:MAG TPA: hypothetical protein VL551_35495 [Actinospica sp.]|jgi:hypothetical protein|nr:hypothetical protein [Actinospica sp.]
MTRRVLCGTVALLAALGVPAASAHAAGPATTAPSCSDGNLAAASVSGTPTSVKAGAAVVDSTRLTDTTAATLSNASFILALIPPSAHGGSGTPQLSWRVDGGSWHAFGLTWSAPSGSGADWQSQVQYIGATFAPKSSHTLDIRTEFTTASPNGEYQYDLAYSADPCSMSELGMNFEYSQYAQGWTQPRPQPSSTTHKPTTVVTTHAAATHTSAAAVVTTPSPTHSQSPTASPSPSVVSASPTSAPADASPTPATVITAQPAASSRSNNHTSTIVFVVLAALVLLGGGLYAGRRSRSRRQS